MGPGGIVTMPSSSITARRSATEFAADNLPSVTPRSLGSPAQSHHCKEEAPRADSEIALSVAGKSRHGVAIAAVLAAMVLVVLDSAIANVALPTLAQALSVTPAMSMWVVLAYQTALLMAMLPCAALGESLGYRRVFTGGVALFVGASALCALSPTLYCLVASRFLQGLGGAAVMALAVALLRGVVPQQRVGAAIGWVAAAVALASSAGPVLGAAIVAVTSWHWLFAISLPSGVLVLFASRALPHVGGTARRLDFYSVALHVGAVASLVIGAALLPTMPLPAATLIATAVVELVVLVRREMPKDSPLIPLDLLGVSSFRLSVIASACCFAGQTAGMVALSFFVQHVLGHNAMVAGLYLTPWPLTVAFTAPFAGWLADRVSTSWLCVIGGACLATGLAAAAFYPMQGNPLPLVAFIALCGFGFGLFNVGNNRNMYLTAPLARSGAAGGMQGSTRLLGQTTGAIILTLLFSLVSADLAPQLGLGIGAVMTLLASLVSALRKRQR